jgi:hypothetical protein
MLRLSLVAALLLAASPLSAQSLYGISGGAAITSTVLEFTGPPAGPCGYPNGPLLGAFPTFVPFLCPTVGPTPLPPAIFGDVAHDHITDLVWATNGPMITAYTPAGVPVTSFPVPPPLGLLTGLGFNSAAGILWMTDGALVMPIVPPGPGCVPPLLIVPPFPSPSPGVLTDIDWDPFTGTLFGCDVLGFVTNMTAAGAIGPFGIFPVLGGCLPPLGPPLQGLAVDTATPSIFGVPLELVVTDGFALHRIAPPAPGGPPTFYMPLPCSPGPGPPISGLAFALHGITYGAGCNTLGGPIPAITMTGNSTTPGVIAINLAGGPPGGLAFLVFDIAPACPPLPFKGCPLYAAPVFLFGPFPIPLLGGIVLPAAIPPGTPIGAGVYLNWVCRQPGGWALSSGLALTIGNP